MTPALQYLEHIQRTNFSNYVKGNQFYKNLYDILGDGIICVRFRSCCSLDRSVSPSPFPQVDGHSWQLQRKTAAKIFTVNNFKGIITRALENQMAKLIAIIDRHANRGEGALFSLSFRWSRLPRNSRCTAEFDLQDLLSRFTLNSLCEMGFGKDIGALNTECDEPVPFAKAFDYGQVVVNRRFAKRVPPVLCRVQRSC
jgi:hypothetical protein